MKIANIVSQNPVKVSKDFNVVDSMEEIIHGIPTLIVGFKVICKLYPDFDITERKVDVDTYWVFKKTERRDDYEIGLEWFTNKVYSDLIAKVNYFYVDPLNYNKKTRLKIVKKIIKIKNKITFIFNDMIYIYGENIIFGVDLKLLDFMGVDIEVLKNKVKVKSSVFLGLSDILIDDEKSVKELGIPVRYIPYLYSIRHEQNNTISSLHFP